LIPVARRKKWRGKWRKKEEVNMKEAASVV
jgi:hypothetical protein